MHKFHKQSVRFINKTTEHNKKTEPVKNNVIAYNHERHTLDNDKNNCNE